MNWRNMKRTKLSKLRRGVKHVLNSTLQSPMDMVRFLIYVRATFINNLREAATGLFYFKGLTTPVQTVYKEQISATVEVSHN